MEVLIFLAHGSRRAQSNEEVSALADQLRYRLGERFDQVNAAYLELVEPSLQAALRSALEDGARRVVIYPYFLNTGNHVAEDIPEIVARFKLEHPECRFELMPHFGKSERIKDMIAEQVLSR